MILLDVHGTFYYDEVSSRTIDQTCRNVIQNRSDGFHPNGIFPPVRDRPGPDRQSCWAEGTVVVANVSPAAAASARRAGAPRPVSANIPKA